MHGEQNGKALMKTSSIWKYVAALAATGATAAVVGLVSHAVVESSKEGDAVPTMDPALANAVAQSLMQQKCADCHGVNPEVNPLLNILSFGKLQRDVDGAQRAFTLEPDASLRSPNVDYLKMDRVLTTRRMPPAAYTAVHLGSRLTPLDVKVLRQRYKEAGATARMFAPISPAEKPETAWDAAKIRLGHLLYHDTRLSTTNTVSCASCHDLTKGGTDNLPKSEGVPGPEGKPQLGGVNAPTTFNAAGHIRQFWDGRAADLKEQAGGPPLNPVEMGYCNVQDWNDIAAKLEQDPEIKALFVIVYGGEGITCDTITDAIAAYERTLVTPGSKFDAFMLGDDSALSDEALSGLTSFVNRGCVSCHSGPALGGISFEYIHTFADFHRAATPSGYQECAHGLADFTKNPAHKDMFRVPTLRNVAMTAPYFHTGTVATLKEAVRVMCETQVSAPVSDAEQERIVKFLEAQTGLYKGKPLPELKPEDVLPRVQK